ncbi:MAG: hypothetical protein ACRDVW_04215, partial [Acidimicrobiales bacterium]
MNDPDRLQHPPLTADTNLTPERSRSLIARQRQEASSELSVDPAPFLVSWGAVWLVDFGAFYFASAPDHLVPLWVAGVVMGALAAAAVLWMVNDLVRRGQGVTG